MKNAISWHPYCTQSFYTGYLQNLDSGLWTGLWIGLWTHSYSGSDQSLFIKKSQKCFWDITVTDRWVVTRPVTDQWSLNVANVIICGKTFVVVCLCIYTVNLQGHISQEKIHE